RADARLALGEHRELAAELEELHRADGQGRVAWGLTAAWEIVSDGSAEHLWVERSFVTRGRIIDDGTRIELNADAGGPGVVDDLEDDLIARAASRGIPVTIVDDDLFGRPERIATTVRPALVTGRKVLAHAGPHRSAA
ncbi:MAG: hypothetical protein ACRDYE_06955, partial [Acidimicrobiales bacterium]